MSLSAQAKVLRVIQEMKFERIGGEHTISVDVRILAATNKDIQEEIQSGSFREDLYFRLNVIPIIVSPLKERPEDILELIDYFMNKFKDPTRESPKHVSSEGIEILKNYPWPGNIRELKNFIERINIMADDDAISAATVNYYLGEKRRIENANGLEEYSSMKLNEAKEEFEKKLLLQKLEENGYNISKTAEALGIYPSNLHGKIKKFGIETKK
jgi:two-component system nitrogen regulation response regulator NtrX